MTAAAEIKIPLETMQVVGMHAEEAGGGAVILLRFVERPENQVSSHH